MSTSFEPFLIILSAPSGGGKTTLCRKLLEEFPNKITLSISSTTRAPRGAEVHGKDYFFLSQEQFKEQIQMGRFAEWALVHGNYYGTSKDTIDQAFAQGKCVLLDIDVQGAESLKKHYPNQNVSIFIKLPSLDVLRRRLEARGTETPEAIERRMQAAQKELEQIKDFDYAILNDDLERAYQDLRKIILDRLRLETPRG